jgi:hypothetical protein
MSPLQRAYLRGLRQGKRQARREAALEEFDAELLSVGSELGAIEETIGFGLTRDTVVCVTSDDGG